MEAKTNTDVRTRNFNLRAYLAGGGATVALIAAAVLVFASLGAYVAFEGLPVGGGEDGGGQIAVESTEPVASVAADRGSASNGGTGDRGPEGGGSGAARGGEGGGDGPAPQLGIPAAAGSAEGGGTGDSAVEPAPQPVEPAPEPNPVQPTSGQDGGGSPVPAPVSEAETSIGDVTGIPIELPDAITSPLEGALDGTGSLGEDLAAELGG